MVELNYLILLILCLTFDLNALSISKCSKNDLRPVILDTISGKIKGQCEHIVIRDENRSQSANVYSWLSVPYAEPPIGKNRFEPPIPVKNWNGILDGTKWPKSCIHDYNLNEDKDSDAYSMWKPNKNFSIYDEDCLYLNIWLPVDAYFKKNLYGGSFKKVPIMVFVHDFGLVSGTSALDVYNPSSFVAATGIIAITLNYRIGIFGFLHIKHAINGNQAFLDQHTAFKWIYDNCERFGGDRTKITLVGSNAGASMIGYHLLYQSSWPLFRNVILQSGSPFKSSLKPISSKKATYRALEFANYIGCESTTSSINEIVKCLKSKSAFELKVSSRNFFIDRISNNNHNNAIHLLTYFPTVIDNVVLNDEPKLLFERNEFKNCSILTGFNANEGSIIIDLINHKINKMPIIDLPNLIDILKQYYFFYPNYPNKLNRLTLDAIMFEYTNRMSSRKNSNLLFTLSNYYRTLNILISHESVVCDVLKLANIYSRLKNSVYVYTYNHRIKTSPWASAYGVVSGDEIAMTFAHVLGIRTNDSLISYNPWIRSDNVYSFSEINFANKILQYWSNFIRYDDPNVIDEESFKLVMWYDYNSKTFKPGNKKVLELNSRNINIVSNYASEKCEFWNYLETNLNS